MFPQFEWDVLQDYWVKTKYEINYFLNFYLMQLESYEFWVGLFYSYKQICVTLSLTFDYIVSATCGLC